MVTSKETPTNQLFLLMDTWGLVYMYIYIYVCVCVCLCVYINTRKCLETNEHCLLRKQTSRVHPVLQKKNRQMLTFVVRFYCLRSCHEVDHSIRIVEYHRKIFSPNPNIFTENRTQSSFSEL
jgi:hypothetical protein